MDHADRYEAVRYNLVTKHFCCHWTVDIDREADIEVADGKNAETLVAALGRLLDGMPAIVMTRDGSELGPPAEILRLPEGTTLA